MTGTKLVSILVLTFVAFGCGGPGETGTANMDPKKPDQGQVDAVKAEGGIPN